MSLHQVKGLASLLKTNTEKGISGDNSELLHRQSVFGVNNYPREKARSFWVFLATYFKFLFSFYRSLYPVDVMLSNSNYGSVFCRFSSGKLGKT